MSAANAHATASTPTPIDEGVNTGTPPTLGALLQARRSEQRKTQNEVAKAIDVSRATLAQWETDRHLPSSENARLLDEYYGAGGALTALADATRGGIPTQAVTRSQSLADVFPRVAAGLLAHLIRDADGTPLGWRHNLGQTKRHTPLSTAYGIRTLLLLDDGHVDLDALRRVLVKARTPDGAWSHRRSPGKPRPEVTAVVLDALSRLGSSADVDLSMHWLEDSIDAMARARPYVLTSVLETVVRLRPDTTFVHTLLDALLDARRTLADALLWPANAGARLGRVEPSLAHTARSVAVLRQARLHVERSDLDDAIGQAVAWIVDREKKDDGVTEILQLDPADSLRDVPIRHLTSAWVVRALAGTSGVPGPRLQAALDTVWSCYSQPDALWVWRSDGLLPIWMTHDAVAALRAASLAHFLTPIPPPENDVDPTRGGTA